MKKQHSLSCLKSWCCALGQGCAVCPVPELWWRELPSHSVCTAQRWARMLQCSGYSTSCPCSWQAQHAARAAFVALHESVTMNCLGDHPAKHSAIILSCSLCIRFLCNWNRLREPSGLTPLTKCFCVPQSLLSDDTLKTVMQDTPWACSAHQLLSSLKGMLHSYDVYICSCAGHTNACAEITHSLTDVHTAFY